MKNDAAQTVLWGPFRMSYAHTFHPRPNPNRGNNEEYNVVLLLPKADTPRFCPNATALHEQIKSTILDICRAEWGPDCFAKNPKTNQAPKFELPLKDGDKVLNGAGEPAHPGYWFLKARQPVLDFNGKMRRPPQNIDGRGVPITGGFESGDWGKVKLYIHPFDQSTNRGVTCKLDGVQWLYHDEHFGKSHDIASEFGAADDYDAAEYSDADAPPMDYAEQGNADAHAKAAAQPAYAGNVNGKPANPDYEDDPFADGN